jgi:hypothetical protein
VELLRRLQNVISSKTSVDLQARQTKDSTCEKRQRDVKHQVFGGTSKGLHFHKTSYSLFSFPIFVEMAKN